MLSVVVTEARRNTKRKGSLSMTCWDTTSPGKWLCPLAVMAPKVIFGSLLFGPLFSSKIGDFSKMVTQKPAALRATDGSRSSRRVDKIGGEHACERKDCQIYKSTDVGRQIKVAQRGTRSKFQSVEGWWAVVATMASMASMVWMAQGGTDVNVSLVPLASSGDEWRRLATNGGVDGWLGSSTQRALTWKSLCVPSGDGGTHRCSYPS